jgi:putative endonuclease
VRRSGIRGFRLGGVPAGRQNIYGAKAAGRSTTPSHAKMARAGDPGSAQNDEATGPCAAESKREKRTPSDRKRDPSLCSGSRRYDLRPERRFFSTLEYKRRGILKTYYVYIMASASRVLYIGVTNNIQRRAVEHRQGLAPGFANQYKARELVYLESFGSIRDAIAREKQLKRWVRAKKIALIESSNPHWKDLSGE